MMINRFKLEKNLGIVFFEQFFIYRHGYCQYD